MLLLHTHCSQRSSAALRTSAIKFAVWGTHEFVQWIRSLWFRASPVLSWQARATADVRSLQRRLGRRKHGQRPHRSRNNGARPLGRHKRVRADSVARCDHRAGAKFASRRNPHRHARPNLHRHVIDRILRTRPTRSRSRVFSSLRSCFQEVVAEVKQ